MVICCIIVKMFLLEEKTWQKTTKVENPKQSNCLTLWARCAQVGGHIFNIGFLHLNEMKWGWRSAETKSNLEKKQTLCPAGKEVVRWSKLRIRKSNFIILHLIYYIILNFNFYLQFLGANVRCKSTECCEFLRVFTLYTQNYVIYKLFYI